MRTSLVESLRTAIDDVLDPILADTRRVALLDFPAHANVGDSAIWLGTLGYLHQKGKTVCYSSDHDTYSRDTLAERLGLPSSPRKRGPILPSSPRKRGPTDGVILLSGGGNFGDIWKQPQRLREQVVRDFPDATIIQLPQTIMFRDEGELARARAIFDAHPSLTLLVRDRRSQRFAAENFRAPALLCPDMAFWLGPLARPSPPTKPVVWLARTDRERGASSPPVGVESVDWLDEPRTPGLRLESFLRELVVEHPRAERTLRSALSRVADRAAAARLRRGCATLSEGRVVVTDRLHAHILSLLLGIPNVILDNSYGKVRDFHETWTYDSELVTLAASAEQAMSLATQRAS